MLERIEMGSFGISEPGPKIDSVIVSLIIGTLNYVGDSIKCTVK